MQLYQRLLEFLAAVFATRTGLDFFATGSLGTAATVFVAFLTVAFLAGALRAAGLGAAEVRATGAARFLGVGRTSSSSSSSLSSESLSAAFLCRQENVFRLDQSSGSVIFWYGSVPPSYGSGSGPGPCPTLSYSGFRSAKKSGRTRTNNLIAGSGGYGKIIPGTICGKFLSETKTLAFTTKVSNKIILVPLKS